MRMYVDCIPCLIRQALDSAKLVTPDEQIHERVVREVLILTSKMDMHQSPPAIAQKVHRLIRELTGNDDPYHEKKRRFDRMAMRMYPGLRDRISESEDPQLTAIHLAGASNVIDFGAPSLLFDADLDEAITQSLAADFDCMHLETFRYAASRARDILYLADNAGEIAFDRLLIEQLPTERVTLAVRGRPVLNDATMEDARAVGLTEIVNVVENGSDAPGTILEDCSHHFRDRFANADLVIAKGQGNYESLSTVDKNIFFLLMAKCPVIARDLGCNVNEMILRRSALFSGYEDAMKGEKTDATV